MGKLGYFLVILLCVKCLPLGAIADSFPSDSPPNALNGLDILNSDHPVLVGDLFSEFSEEPTPDPNEYSRLHLLAKQGDPNAQYRLAVYEYRTAKNTVSMLEWLHKAAVQNHVKAQVALGNCHRKGVGVSSDANEAISWYRRAAEQGSPEAQYNLFAMYYDGDGVKKDLTEAIKWLKRAGEHALPDFQYTIANIFQRGAGIPQNSNEAMYWYTKAAEQGYAAAQSSLGLMYIFGEGVPQDYTEAAKWLTKAAEQGDSYAQLNLGIMYNRGQGVQQNHKEAAKWYTKAAEQGNPRGQFNLAVMYGRGQGVPQDYTEAVKWLTKAAEQGDAAAQWSLGEWYIFGEGVPQDYTEAVKWLTKAAEQGYAAAQFSLGEKYIFGEGVPKDYTEAAKWLTKAAEQGDAGAQGNLGVMYYNGQGVLEDYAEGYKWVLLAAMNGLDAAQKAKDILRKRMTASQIEDGRRRAKEFVAEQDRRSKQGRQDTPNINITATGFLITPDGYLLTACHAVAKTVRRIKIFYQGRTYAAQVISKDESTDAALLRIEGTGFTCLPFVSNAAVKTGDAVFTVGFPQVDIQGVEPKFTEGSVSSLSGLAGSLRFLQISVPIQPGNSGGPLVNEKGEVVGLIVSRLDDVAALMATGAVPQTVNYALKSSFILPLIESVPGLAENLLKASAVKDRSAAIEKARQAVVLIVGYNEDSDL